MTTGTPCSKVLGSEEVTVLFMSTGIPDPVTVLFISTGIPDPVTVLFMSTGIPDSVFFVIFIVDLEKDVDNVLLVVAKGSEWTVDGDSIVVEVPFGLFKVEISLREVLKGECVEKLSFPVIIRCYEYEKCKDGFIKYI